MRTIPVALMMVLPLLHGCGSAPLAADPGEATIIYRGWARSGGERFLTRVVLTARTDSPYLGEAHSGDFARLLPEEDMAELLRALEDAGLGDLPFTEAAGPAAPVPNLTVEAGGRSRVWVGRLDRLGESMENLTAFRRAEKVLVPWAGATRMEARTR